MPKQGDSRSIQTKLLMDLINIYINNNKKYKGEEYNILDVKLQVFYDCCFKIRLLEEQYYNIYLVMLKEYISNFYYNKLASREYDFKTIINFIKTHFKIKENYQKYLSEWRETTLLYIILENLGKLRLEYF